MPNPLVDDVPRSQHETLKASFPAHTRQCSGLVNGKQTDVMRITFADKMVVTLSQGGRLAQWVHVPLESQSPSMAERHVRLDQDEGGLLPMSHLTAKTILGGASSERETMGHLYATQIASAIASKCPNERRLLVVGLGLEEVDTERESFLGVIDLVLRCL